MRSTGFLTKAILLVCFTNLCAAQNLVPNGAFETTSGCPSGISQLSLALPWDPLGATPDLFNSCSTDFISCAGVSVPHNYAGNAAAHSGNGYAGIVAKHSIANYREYIQAPLASPLIPGKLYKAETWFRRSSNSTHAVVPLGMMLSVGAIIQSGSTYLGFPPQVSSSAVISDTGSWTVVRDYIIAAGGENYITIGNFNDDGSSGIVSISNTSSCPFNGAFYYVDDVSVQLINEQVSISGDLLVCPGTSTTLYANANTPVWWSLSDNPGVSVSTGNSLTVNPLVNTSYILNGLFHKDSATVVVIPPPVVSLRNDTIICERDSVFLNAANNNSTYQWSTGETTSSIYAAQDEKYIVNVDNGGCAVSDTFNLDVLTNPPIDLGNDTVYCAFNYDFITLDAGTGISYLWEPTSETSEKIIARAPGTYTVTVDYQNGCRKDTSITIKEVCPPKFFVPSSFTPNDDGLNDALCPMGNSYESFQFMVFNRWGEIVFSTNHASTCWDGTVKGKKAPTGVYAYTISFTAINEFGETEKSRKAGTVSVIR
ncbi:MAG TPA: gliding motility-associated C-terminal domain-containing protein [Bacteroidia bacterium]|nr:gliding motility-associated C-terminal domain-containing protein [Bacteroidia bacterium]